MGDPQSERTFSGSARQLFRAIARQGALAGAWNVEGGTWPRRFRVAVAGVRHGSLPLGKLLSAWEPDAIRAASRRAARRLRRARGVDACLLYGTNVYPAEEGERASIPVGAALDATFAQIARSGEWAFGLLTPAEVSRCVERQAEVLSRCAVLFPRSRWCAESLERDYGIPPERCIVTGAGSNFDEPLPGRAGHDGSSILFVGRDWHRKNGPLVLDAFREARKRRPDLTLAVVGPRLPDPGEPGVRWLGPLDASDREALRREYLRASLLLSPSRSEAFGIAMVEAQAAGCPVLTLDRGAAREIVVDGVTGERLRDAEPAPLADAILRWLGDPARLTRAGARARAHVAEHFTWDLAAARVVGAFADLRDAASRAGSDAARRVSGVMLSP